MFRLAEKRFFHPVSVTVPLSVGRQWRGGGGWCYEEKIDGERAMLLLGQLFGRSRVIPFIVPASLNNCCLDGEFAGGVFHAFDALNVQGQDMSREPLRIRRAALADLLRTCLSPVIRPVANGNGGEFLEAILARGGEGIVAKHLESTYGQPESWVKCKRVETHDCFITEIHPAKQSVRLVLNGLDAGWCGILGKKFSRVKVGRCIEVSCHSIHPSGKLREPRFVRFRADKG